MENEFANYEQSLSVKELGFDEMCFGFYRNPIVELMRCRNSEPWMGNGVVAAPLKQQVFKFFREKYELGHTICPYYFNANITELQDVDDYPSQHEVYVSSPFTYEEAENACIDKLISICKQQDNGTSN